MSNISVEMKRKKFDKIYKSHADNIYRICLYFSKDEKEAKRVSEQVFIELYKELDKVDSKHAFAYLAPKAKRLSVQEKNHEFAKEMQR